MANPRVRIPFSAIFLLASAPDGWPCHWRDVEEAAHLFVLREKSEECIEDDEDEGVALGDPNVCEIAHGDGDCGTPWFGPQLRDHRLGNVDAVDFNPAFRQWQGHPSGADA